MYRSDHGPERCSKFGPGEEKAARLYLRNPPEQRRYWMIPNRAARIGLVWGSWAAPLILFALFRWRGTQELVYESCGVLFLILLAVSGGIILNDGLFVLDPIRELVRYARKNHGFAQLPLPRVTKSSLLVSSGDAGASRVVSDTLSLGRLVLFNGQSIPLKRIHRIADLLNAMLAEYHEREEVRAWLEQRGMLDDPEAGKFLP